MCKKHFQVDVSKYICYIVCGGIPDLAVPMYGSLGVQVGQSMTLIKVNVSRYRKDSPHPSYFISFNDTVSVCELR